MATSTDLRSAIEEVQEQLPEEQLPAEGEQILGETDWTTRLERRVGALPWWVISAATHAVVFLLIALLATAVAPAVNDEVVIATDVVKQKPPEYDPLKKRDLFKSPTDIKSDTVVEQPVVTHDKMEETDHFETDNNMDKNTARGNEDAISDIPLGGTGTVGSIGVGGGGTAGAFGYRDGGGRKKSVGRYGGSEATESSVEAALLWLARHQEPEGHWEPKKWEGTTDAQVAMTGIALLAFLGAGYTSNTPGRFQDNVRRAQKWLADRVQLPNKDGVPGHPGFVIYYQGNKNVTYYANQYEQGIATLALAEAYGMSQAASLKEPAQQAVDFVLYAQGPYEAWTYKFKGGKAGRNDTSVSGWNLMALKSAKIAGLKVDGAGFQGCMRWLDAATDPANGRCAYEGHIPGKVSGFGSDALCAAGMLMRQFMGVPREDPLLNKSVTQLDKRLPIWSKGPGGKPGSTVNFYYWYYGTLCMFQMGGKHWETWNREMKKSLLENQLKGGPLDGSAADKDGSWDPHAGLAVAPGGRVFATALGALCLEVYYRYLPMYGK